MTDKTVLLIASFGSSYKQTRESDIGGIETAMQKSYPEYQVRRAFTSHAVIDAIADTEKAVPDDLCQAIDRMINEGIKHVIVQPTYVINGREYQNTLAILSKYADKFESLRVGTPLLNDNKDIDTLADVLISENTQYAQSETAIVYVGHGVRNTDNDIYQRLQQSLKEKGAKNCFIGTLQAVPSLDDVIASVKKTDARKVVLLPLMITAGSHACRNMAGDSPDSWKSAFENAGFEVQCVLKGLGQYSGVRKMFAQHTANANRY